MSNYTINFDEDFNSSDIESLNQVLNIVGENDELLITLDKGSDKDSFEITKVLKSKGFNIVIDNSKEHGKYNIIARRNENE